MRCARMPHHAPPAPAHAHADRAARARRCRAARLARARCPGRCVIVLHCNHANEIDATVRAAAARLRATRGDAAEPVGAAAGVNDSVDALERAVAALWSARRAALLPAPARSRARRARTSKSPSRARAQLMAQLAARLPGYLCRAWCARAPARRPRQCWRALRWDALHSPSARSNARISRLPEHSALNDTDGGSADRTQRHARSRRGAQRPAAPGRAWPPTAPGFPRAQDLADALEQLNPELLICCPGRRRRAAPRRRAARPGGAHGAADRGARAGR